MTSTNTSTNRANIFTTGFAIFSMFFGAGNVIFPLALGLATKDMSFYASIGLAITAIGMPFLGLLAMTLFDGNYHAFFQRMGRWPGLFLTVSIIALIGPFAAMPRTITVAYATITPYLPEITLWQFSLVACFIVFISAFIRDRLLDILGKFLTPILLASLAFIIILGLIRAPIVNPSEIEALTAFLKGLHEGYNTMDLLASFFFSAVVLKVLEKGLAPNDTKNHLAMITQTLKAGCIGLSLLFLVYGGFTFVSASYAESLGTVPVEQALTATAIHIMGPHASIIACIAVALACLTTAIALAVVSSDYLRNELLNKTISYPFSLLLVTTTCFLVSTLDFQGIAKIVTPVLVVAYPALIVLSVCNLLYKLKGFKPVKTPVFITFILSLIYHIS